MRRLVLLLSLLVAASALASEPVTLTGRVLIQNAGPRTVLAFIESDDTGITHVLRLSAEEAFPQNPVSWQFDRAHVEIGADRFVITSAAQRMSVIFAVTLPAPAPAKGLVDGVQPESAAPRTDLASVPEHNAVLLRGYWLSSRSVAPGQSIAAIKRSPKIAALFCDVSVSGDVCDDMGGTGATGTGPATSCSSGGSDAISCSCTSGSTGCTVTCGSGYYACCKDCYVLNGPNCRCVKN
jgi:hypothetical protein